MQNLSQAGLTLFEKTNLLEAAANPTNAPQPGMAQVLFLDVDGVLHPALPGGDVFLPEPHNKLSPPHLLDTWVRALLRAPVLCWSGLKGNQKETNPSEPLFSHVLAHLGPVVLEGGLVGFLASRLPEMSFGTVLAWSCVSKLGTDIDRSNVLYASVWNRRRS